MGSGVAVFIGGDARDLRAGACGIEIAAQPRLQNGFGELRADHPRLMVITCASLLLRARSAE